MEYSDFVMQWYRVGHYYNGDATAANLLACTQCERKFVAWDWGCDDGRENKQATNCAAAVYTREDGTIALQGFYGSTVADMEVYKFLRDAPEPCDPVCDYCITEWIRDGRIEFVEEL